MTGKKYLLLTLFIFIQLPILAKSDHQLKHVKGLQSIGIQLGTITIANYYQIDYKRYILQKNFVRGGLLYAQGEKAYHYLALQAKYGHCLTPLITNAVFLNAAAGLTVLMEYFVKKNFQETEASSKFNFGPLLSLETECFLSNRFMLATELGARLLFLEAFYGKIYPFGQIGIRYRL